MRYTKTALGLSNAQDVPKIKVYACAEDACEALVHGDFTTGELFSIPVVNGSIFDDLSSEVAEIKSFIPNSTSTTNQLTNVTQVQEMIAGGGADYSACWTRLCNVETCADQNHSAIMQIGAVIPSDASSSNQLVTSSDFTSATNRITCLESCNGLNCVGTVTSATLSTGTVTPTSGALDLTTLATVSEVNSVSGDLTTLSGTVSAQGTNISCLNTCTCDLVTCDACLQNQIIDLAHCPGLSCTGTLTSANFSLSGDVLTITI